MPWAEVRQTHAGAVFLVGDRAYKLKKPVQLGFLDFSTRERRLAALRNELELNRRLAPDVYLGISDIADIDGSPLDHLLVMRRLPDERRLAHLVRSGVDVTDDLRAVAALLAEFHEHCARGPGIDADGTGEALALRWRRNLEAARPHVGGLLDRGVYEEIRTLVDAYLSGRSALFAARLTASAVLDGHGDLLADDIFLLEDGPRVLDCLEFDEHLRHVDRLDDVCSLAMDLERLGAIEAARVLLETYRGYDEGPVPTSLVHHFVAYRAFVRAMVACLPDAADPDSAASLMDLAYRHLVGGQIRLILVGGPPGTGKTSVARGLATALGWRHLRSDEVRKALAGLEPADRASAQFGEGLYTQEWSQRTYDELLRLAEAHLTMGESVILDATWSDAGQRKKATRLAQSTSSHLVQVRCEVPADVAAERIRLRHGDASDADAAVAAAMRAGFDDWPDAVAVDTTDLADVVDRLIAQAAGRGGPRPAGSGE